MSNSYKDTLLIGQTNFDMRANLKDKEPLIQEEWSKNDIYNKRILLNQHKPLFMLHDGPPYANGDLHLGHALNKSLKDFIIRWKNSYGFNAPFILGWDTHGLPIETAITKSGVDRKAIPTVEFRRLCETYALSQVDIQAKQFQRLGVFTDLKVNYITLSHNFEMSELRLFQTMFNNKLIYKALKPIYWSPSSESALAESEIEYKDIKSPTIFVALEVSKGNDKVDKGFQIVIWTTTPWTIPSNQLVAVGKDIDYVAVKVQEDTFIIAKNLLDNVANEIGWENYEVKKIIKGSDLIGIEYIHPLYDKKISHIVAGHHVTDDAGTGLVHIASGFGEDDFLIAKENGIEPFSPIDNQGNFTKEIAIYDEDLVGVFYEDANKIIGTKLKQKNKLLKLKFSSHSYPHDWRTKKPVIYRCTYQWFINLKPIKHDILKNVDSITTRPEWAKSRLYQVLEDRVDWTISRQRLWGVPIIAFYDAEGTLILNDEILTFAINKIDELGTNSWFEKPADVFLPSKFHHLNLQKEKDILDVWFDSGSSAIALSERFKELKLPYDVYLEGSDQYRGWFNASMINSTIYSNRSPYKKLISHGMTVDEKGNKMSKSLGNGIDPIDFANNQGIDILRLWVSSTDYSDDQKIGPEIIKQISESYRKIRNTLRFILANLFDFDPINDYQNELEEVDRFSLHNLTFNKKKAIESYENFAFNQVYSLVMNYVSKDLSAFYLDFIKDILYVEAAKSKRRKQVQTVLFEQLKFLIDVLRPIIPHTIEETYQNFNINNKKESVILEDLFIQEFNESSAFVKKWNEVLGLREAVNKSLEIAREAKIINKGFEAIVNISLDETYNEISKIKGLAQIFIVNKIAFSKSLSTGYESKFGKILVQPKNGMKCQRCWALFDDLINSEICQRCYDVVQQLEQIK